MIKNLIVLSLSHLLVDASCIFLLYYGSIQNNIDFELSFYLIVFYNVLAFGLQALIGKFFDNKENPKLCAMIGCLLTAFGLILWKYYILACFLVGVGNAFFHVGGGIICLKSSRQKATIPGIFVSTGALGLFLGAVIAHNSYTYPFIFFFLLIFSSICIYFLKIKNDQLKNTYKTTNKFLIIIIFLLLAVVIRSYIGLSINLQWKENILFSFYLALSIFLGKMFGGIIADKFGWLKTSIIALMISSPLIAFCIEYPILFIIGMFFFNFTMTITLIAIANLMQKQKKYTFGLTTLALLIGALQTFVNPKLDENNSFQIFVVVILSAIFIFIGLKNYTSNTNIDDTFLHK